MVENLPARWSRQAGFGRGYGPQKRRTKGRVDMVFTTPGRQERPVPLWTRKARAKSLEEAAGLAFQAAGAAGSIPS